MHHFNAITNSTFLPQIVHCLITFKLPSRASESNRIRYASSASAQERMTVSQLPQIIITCAVPLQYEYIGRFFGWCLLVF